MVKRREMFILTENLKTQRKELTDLLKKQVLEEDWHAVRTLASDIICIDCRLDVLHEVKDEGWEGRRD